MMDEINRQDDAKRLQSALGQYAAGEERFGYLGSDPNLGSYNVIRWIPPGTKIKTRIGYLRFNPMRGISMHLAVDGNLSGKLHPVERAQGNMVYHEDEKGEKTIGHQKIHETILKENLKLIRSMLSEARIVVANSSNENLFWNKPVVTYLDGKLYYAVGERNNTEGRTCSMVVIWKDGQITIEESVSFKFKEEDGVESDIYIDGEIATEKVSSATFIQLIKNEKGFVNPKDRIDWYDDLRHLFSTARFTYEDIEAIPEDLMSGGIFFGIDQMAKEDGSGNKLSVKAIDGPVEMGLFMDIQKADEKGAIESRHIEIPADLLSERLIKKLGYETVSTEAEVKQKGQFCIDETKKTIKIFFKENIYPWHIVGTTKDKEVVDIAIDGLSGTSGCTIYEAFQLMEKLGVEKAGILDQGVSVRLTLGEEDHLIISEANSEKIPKASSIIFYTTAQNAPLLTNDVFEKKREAPNLSIRKAL